MTLKQAKKIRHSPFFYWRWLIVILLGGILAVWISFTPEGVLGKADSIGYAVCHRIDLRSFHLDDRQFPLCARCTGQYLGALTGVIFQAVTSRRRAGSPPRRVIAGLVVLAAFYGIDGVNSYLHLPIFLSAFPNLQLLYEPNNVLRVMTGTGMGLVISAALYPAFISTLYQQYDQAPAIPGLRHLLLMVACALVVSGLSLTHIDWLLYPLALISSAGVPLLLGMIYTIMILMIFKKENHYQQLSQAIYPILFSLLFVLLQIVIMDIGRFLLTGTWGEFPIG